MHSAKGTDTQTSMQFGNLILGECPCNTLKSISQQALHMQAAVLLRPEPHPKNSNAVVSKKQAEGPDVLDSPQSTRLADARTLVRFPDTAVTFADLLVSSLHDSMSDFEQSEAESLLQGPVPLCYNKWQIVVGTSGHER